MVVGNYFTHDPRVYREAKTLASHDYQVTVFARRGNGLKSEEDLDNNIKVKRFEIKNFNFIRFNPLEMIKETIPLVNILASEKASVYHAHDLDTLLLVYLAAKKANAKLIYDSHELYLESTHKLIRFSFFKNIKYKGKMFLSKLSEKFVSRRVGAVITVNDSIADELSKRYKIKKPRVLLNVPMTTFTRTKELKRFHEMFNLGLDKKIVLFQGGITWERGVKQLIEAAKFFDDRIILVLMGPSGKLKYELPKLIKEMNLEKKIKMVDQVPLLETAYYTASADIGVIPYLNVCLNHYYCLPNKFFEYMHAGLPVAVSNFPEMSKIVEKNKIGVTFDPENPKDIADKINSIFSDKKKYEDMKTNALKAAKEKYNWEIESKKLLSVYEKVLKK